MGLDHDWRTVSRHPTSEGEVHYERCHCDAHRVRLIGSADRPIDLAHPHPPAFS